MISRFVSVAICFVLVSSIGAFGAETVFYVSPLGDDAASGTTLQTPFKTITRARDAVRAVKQTGPLNQPVIVYLREGRYELSAPLVFESQDSGAPDCPVTYMAYRHETPVITGGRSITGWTQGEDGLWEVDLPEVRSGQWTFTQLYVNGRLRSRPRLPKEGYYKIANFSQKDKSPWAARSDNFTFRAGDIKASWLTPEDIDVVVPRFWVSSRQHIKSVDEATNHVTFTASTGYRYSDDFTRQGARYYVENVFEALDFPGQWYLDRKAGRLLYKPMPGEDMRAADVVAPYAPKFIELKGDSMQREFVEYIHFKGLTFVHNNWQLPKGNVGDGQSAPQVEGAVMMEGAQYCQFDRCVFRNLSSYCFQIDKGCSHNRITHSEMGHLGGGGVRMGGGSAEDHPLLLTGNNTISDNTIHHIGQIHHAATGVWIQHSGGNVIAHNAIHHTYYSAIAVGWVWGYLPSVSTHNVFEYNHIHDVGQEVLSDMGGIYMLGVAPGTVVRNNLIHDIQSHGYGGWGIYTDEGSTHVLIENNIVYNTKCAGFDQHYGKENMLRNNIFALGHEEQINRSRMEEHISFTMTRNIIYWQEDIPALSGQWQDKTFQHRPGKPWFDSVSSSTTEIFDYNLYYNPNKTLEDVQFGPWTFAQWQARKQDLHSEYADPLFVNPEQYDFRLKPESPAFALGFRPIDMSTVGPRD